MQVAAGVQGHGGLFGLQVLRGIGGEYILFDMPGPQAQAVAQTLPVGDQRGIAFQAQQRRAGMRQAPAEMALAGAPVQPVPGRLGEVQAAGEGLDLLPLASGDVDLEVRRQLRLRLCRQFADATPLELISGIITEKGVFRPPLMPLL